MFIRRSYICGRAPNLNRLSRARKMEKISLLILFSIRAILSRVYVQLDVRLVEEGYREVVCSWKSSELESAESYEENGKNLALKPIQCSRNSQSCVCSIGCSAS